MVNIIEKMVDKVWWIGGVCDVYVDFNELIMEIVVLVFFGVFEVFEEMV